MLKFHDGRFATHPRFRFLLFNFLMRQRARSSARYFVKSSEAVGQLSQEELQERLADGDGLLNSVVRQGSCLRGTRPYWRAKGANLEAHAHNLPHLSPVFVTYSCADHQWDDLQRHMPGYDTWTNGTDQERRKLAWENIQNNPQIVAAWLHL
jgi:hypothetical protein